MIKTVLNVEGMMCGMCEKHLNEAIQKVFSVEKISSSHTKQETEILSEAPLDEELLRTTVDEAGYTLREIHSEPYKKKGFSLFR